MIVREWEDKPHFRGLRNYLTDELKKMGITDENVLEVINSLPRHFFINVSYIDYAYENRPLPIPKDQTISQPYTVAFQTQLLMPLKSTKVLEIGTGSGYQAAVLALLGAEVHTIERHKELYKETTELLNHKNFIEFFGGKLNIHTYYGDGYKGLPGQAPFDRIIITAAIQEIPGTLFDQLAENGMLVAPIGNRESQVMTRFKKQNGKIEKETFGNFIFVPMLKGTE